jgi:hypothetical protein
MTSGMCTDVCASHGLEGRRMFKALGQAMAVEARLSLHLGDHRTF